LLAIMVSSRAGGVCTSQLWRRSSFYFKSHLEMGFFKEIPYCEGDWRF
jgi:hypothetical protein